MMIEKLFVQIFERKKRIIEQVKYQTDLFDQHLASKCILDGIAPPSWLWSPSFLFLSSDPNESTKEELIPGLLLPRPQPANPYSCIHCSLYQKPNAAGNEGFPNASRTEIPASRIGSDADDEMSVLSLFPTADTQCTCNGVLEPVCSVTSQDCADARVSDNCPDLAQSLVKIQRSKSRQRALELRNSAEATKSHSRDDNHATVCASQHTRSGINSLQFDHVDELELVKPVDTNTEVCEEEEEKAKTGGTWDSGTTTKSGNSSLSITAANGPGNDGNSSHFAKDDGLKDYMNESVEKCNHVNKLPERVNPSVLSRVNLIAEEAKMVDFRGNEMDSNVVSDRVTRYRSSISQASTLKKPLEVDIWWSLADEDGVLREAVDKSAKQPKSVKPSSVVSNEFNGSSKAKARDKLTKGKGSNISVGRTTRSGSSIQQPNCVNEYLEMDNACGNGEENDVSKPKQLFNHDNGLRDSVNPIGITYKSPGLRAKVTNCQKVASNDACCQRITRSSSADVYNIIEFPKVDLCSDVIKDGDAVPAQSFRKSSQLPQQFVDGRINLQVLPISQPKVPSCTSSILAETVVQHNGVVLASSVPSESNSDGGRCGVEVLELRPPSECVMSVKPKQLNFNDVEEGSLLETSNSALKNKQEGSSNKRLFAVLHSVNLLDKVTSIGYQEKPNPSIDMPLLEQKLPIKEEKLSSEAHMKDKAGLVDESTVNPVQQKMDEFISQNRNADFYFVGSWPQHKRKKIECQLTNAFSASPTLKIGDAVQSDVGKNPLKDMHRNVEHQRIEEYKVSSSKLQVEEIEIGLEGRGRSASTACNLMLEQGTPSVPSLKKLGGEHETGQHTAEEKILFQFKDKLEVRGTEVMPYTEDTILEKKDHLDRKDLSYGSSGSHSQIQSVICSDQNMPEYEGFVMETDDEQLCTSKEGIDFDKLDLPPKGLGRASVLEQFCKSTCLHSSFLDLPATYKLQEALNLCQSLPNGLFENIEQLDSSFRCLNQEVNQALHESHSVSPPLSDSQSAWDIRKLCASPVGKLWGGMPPKSSSSGKRVSSIPELPCISEENEITDGVIGTFLEGVGPEMFISSVTREPLADITKNSNPLVSVYEAELNDDRNSIASLYTEFSFSGTCDRVRTKLGNKNKSKRGFTGKDKENQNFPLEGDSFKRGNGSLHGSSSKPKLSGKSGSVNGGLGLSVKESKCNNIASNVTSFIPFVQQKQAVAVVTGKRDIKVKALEAAEAAKRLAEKKENDRKMRKEALKLERARFLEEQNLRQLEPKKKKKEQKKREADTAARKRQREEERKERERKRKHIEEAKKHQLVHEKKLHAEKEQKEDGRTYERKESKDRLRKYNETVKAEEGHNLQTVPNSEPTTTDVSKIDTINAGIIPEDSEALSDCGDNSEVMSYFCKESDSLICNLFQEQSYEISPYKGSDDEDEEDDDNIRDSKFVPSWASKSHLALVVSSQPQNPESIFPRASFCSISEVLLPRKLQPK